MDDWTIISDSYINAGIAREITALQRAFTLSRVASPNRETLVRLISDYRGMRISGYPKVEMVIEWRKGGVPPMVAAVVANTLWDLDEGIFPPNPTEKPAMSEIVTDYAKDAEALARKAAEIAGDAFDAASGVLWPLAILAVMFVGWKVMK